MIKGEKKKIGLMLKVDNARWNQSKELLRQEALTAKHPRTRERLMALYEISQGLSATSVSKSIIDLYR
ncbi:MAG: hypothetical protein HC939_15340 [Pleurocapsa sp. SU_5_0]|nr:hypothetical protein [Pleurocapsa sp. SU_5_0]NJO95827.1 hypothetical protein [Pleurocapsa sp. CRU_1_2]